MSGAAARSGPLRPRPGPGWLLHVTPKTAGWDYLEFSVVEVTADAPISGLEAGRETAIVPLSGSGVVTVMGVPGASGGAREGAGETARAANRGEMVVEVSRSSVFEELARIVYVPPGRSWHIQSDSGLRVSVGSAPAEGHYPVRVIEPQEMRIEIRGGRSGSPTGGAFAGPPAAS